MPTDYEKAMNSLWKDVRDLRADLKAVVDAVRDGTKERLDAAGSKVHGMAADRIANLRRSAETIKEHGGEALATVRETIEQRPLASLLTAVGVGLAIGGLIRWRRR